MGKGARSLFSKFKFVVSRDLVRAGYAAAGEGSGGDLPMSSELIQSVTWSSRLGRTRQHLGGRESLCSMFREGGRVVC